MKQIPVRHITGEHHDSPVHFKIRELHTLMNGGELVQALHRHDFFFVLALRSGTGIHEIDFQAYEVTANVIFIMRPGQVHQLILKPGTTGYLMEFSPSFYHPHTPLAIEKLRRASNKNYCRPPDTAGRKLLAILAYIFEEFSEQQEGYSDIIKANIEIFFTEFLRQHASDAGVSTAANSYTQIRLEEFYSLLESHIGTHKQVHQYAALMNVSTFQLNRIAKQSVGKNASDLIIEHIILEAKRQLLSTTNQVKDVADQLGYEDVSYFIRFFKRHTGYTPDAFRQNSR